MATFKSVISSYKKSDGTRNVMILVFHNNDKCYPKINFFLDKDDLMRSLKIKNQFYNAMNMPMCLQIIALIKL